HLRDRRAASGPQAGDAHRGRPVSHGDHLHLGARRRLAHAHDPAQPRPAARLSRALSAADVVGHAARQPQRPGRAQAAAGKEGSMMRFAALLLLAAAAEPQKMEFDKYQLIILRSAPGARELSKEEHAKLMEGHLGHFRKMAAEGKMVVAGPFDEQDDKT